MPESNHYNYRQIGSTGCEILTPDGTVVAWTVDETLATHQYSPA